MYESTKDSPPEERTIYVANFEEKVTEDILEELFLQAGPLVKVMVRDVKDSSAKYALVEFEDGASVMYAITLMNGVRLYDRELQVKPRNNTRQEDNFRRRRGEIEEIWRGSRDGHRYDRGGKDWDRDRRGGDYRNSNRDQRESRDSRNSRDWNRRDTRGNINQHNDRNRSSGGSDRYREGNGNGQYNDASWMHQNQHSQPRHPPNRDQQSLLMPPPPPPPPLMGGGAGNGNWKGSAPSLLPSSLPPPPFQQHSTPMLPHQHFVQMMQEKLRNSAPPAFSRDSGRHDNQSLHQNQRHSNYQNQMRQQYDHRGADRDSANHRYHNRQNQKGASRGRY